MKRTIAILAAVILIATIWFFALRPRENPSVAKAAASVSAPASHPADSLDNAAAAGKNLNAPPTEILNLATDLNAPGRTIQQDLQVLDGVFSVWQTNFLHDGNPVGDNVEITAALTGRNTLHVAFLAPHHPAINARGELCDRWGTPFFFHQVSGTKMEIRSAGPDRKRGTADDVVFTP